MSSEKFTVVVTTTNEYEIDIDTAVWTPEAIKQWSSVFWTAESIEDIVRDISQAVVRRDHDGEFMEGFGHLQIFKQYENERQATRMPEGVTANKHIQVTVISEDDDYNFEINKEQ